MDARCFTFESWSTSTHSPPNAIFDNRAKRSSSVDAPPPPTPPSAPPSSPPSAPVMTSHAARMSHPGVPHAGSLLCAGNTSVSAETNSARLASAWRGPTLGISLSIAHT